MKLLAYLTFLVLLAPCNKQQPVASATTDPDPSTVNIIHQRSVCFGKCPAYTLTIDGKTRQMTYHGKSDVEKLGTYTREISLEQLKELIRAFEKAEFFKYEEKYLGTVSDFPSRYTTYTVGERSKKVQNRHNGPESLKELEEMLDKIASGEGWKKAEGEN